MDSPNVLMNSCVDLIIYKCVAWSKKVEMGRIWGNGITTNKEKGNGNGDMIPS